tara:strand:- start:174 stop:698 length:525 start_codon:yes stop_codon:yes gene_type:complete
MKYNFYIISIFFFSLILPAIDATTEDGKKVILHNDGTWKFENPAENAKFNLVEFKGARFESHEKNYAREENPNAHIRAFFQFQNNSDRKIVAIRYKFSLVDPFDEVLYYSIVKDNVIINAGETSKMDTYYYFEDTFQKDDTYDIIIDPVLSNNLRAKVKIMMIVFENGTKVKYN